MSGLKKYVFGPLYIMIALRPLLQRNNFMIRSLYSYGASLGIHTVALLLVVFIANGQPSSTAPVTIDLTINAVQGPSESPPAPRSHQQLVRPHAVSRLPRPSAPVAAIPEKNIQDISDVVSRQDKKEQPDKPDLRPAVAHTVQSGPAGKGNSPASPGTAVEDKEGAVRGKYLKEQFQYIRERIADNARYPRHARRMGWCGVVHISFIIEPNGNVSDIRIVKSSGVSVLDEEASDSVRRSAPFPKPPVRARIVIPVEYALS